MMNGVAGLLVLVLSLSMPAQVYSPRVLKEGQPDSTDLHEFARSISITPPRSARVPSASASRAR
jgi:hypothetical protein